MKYLDGKREEKLHCRNLRSCGAIMARPREEPVLLNYVFGYLNPGTVRATSFVLLAAGRVNLSSFEGAGKARAIVRRCRTQETPAHDVRAETSCAGGRPAANYLGGWRSCQGEGEAGGRRQLRGGWG